MDDEFSFNFPELDEEIYENKENGFSTNIDKIYEYLNNDLERDEYLIIKLKEFEERLDKYLKE